MIVLCDLDGTVADNSHRMPFIEKPNKDWGSFYHPLNIEQDKPIVEAQRVVPKLFRQKAVWFYFLTGRPERTRAATTDWLRKHIDVPLAHETGGSGVRFILPHEAQIFMRQDGDHRPANIYKEEMVRWFATYTSASLVMVDDDLRNEAMYAKYGTFLKAPECWSVFR